MTKPAKDGARREVPVIRIFLSSPGDVAEERKMARQLIDSELPKSPHYREKVRLEVIAWDDPAAQIPMLATQTPQESVNAARPRPATCDIVIVILWSRMGTPLPDTMRKPNGDPYLSGTEWEYEDAIHSSLEPKPEVLVYRRSEEPKVELSDPDLADRLAQFQKVKDFFAQFRNADGSLEGGVNPYEAPGNFETLLRQHLEEILYRRLPASADGGAPTIAADIPPDYVAWLQRTCADVSLLGQDIHKSHAFTLNHVYVPALTRQPGDPQHLVTADGTPVFPGISVGQGKDKPVTLLERLDAESLYVPAPAGAGKSTFCRWAVLQSVAGAEVAHPVPAPEDFAEPLPAGLRGRLPLLVPLRDFAADMDCGRGRQVGSRSDLETALAAWVDRTPPQVLSGSLLRVHLDAGSAFLLLDGLDEVPVSDVRDGVTCYPRELLLSGLADALPAWQEVGNRVLLTSRPYGLDEAGIHRLRLPAAPLEPLPQPLQDLFVSRWFHTLGKEEQIAGLIATIRDRDDLTPLVENPMLLTAICVLYDSGGRLPEDRYDLYRRIVNTVLFHRFRDEVRHREPARARLEAIALGMHMGDAESPRSSPAPEISSLEIERLLRAFAAEDASYEEGRVKPAVQREELLTRSGLLLPRPNDRAAFYHLSFQEFLAAERILRTEDDLLSVFRERAAVAEWRLTLLFLFAGKITSKTPRWGSDLLLKLIADQTPAAVKASPTPAVFIAEALDLCLAKKYAIPTELEENYRRLALNAIEDEIELQSRQMLGLTLGRVGDPRIHDLRGPRAYVEIPAGRYPYGEKGQVIEIANPFRLGRYPVTNSQYEAFIDDGGYRERKWWSEAGWGWLRRKGATEPDLWRDRRWNGPNQPVVGVSFWEAEACCNWAGGRLPSEEEWEAAARGAQGLVYPWGNDWQAGICSTLEAQLGVTSPVGLFPSSRQLNIALDDMAGNVWQWCASFYHKLGEGPDAPRVLRGGSWDLYRGSARSANRDWYNPDSRFNLIGFRVVCSSPSAES